MVAVAVGAGRVAVASGAVGDGWTTWAVADGSGVTVAVALGGGVVVATGSMCVAVASGAVADG